MSIAEKIKITGRGFPQASDVIKSFESGELFFAVVGHVGSGISEVATTLQEELETKGFDVEIIKASSAIKEWALANNHAVPEDHPRQIIEDTFAYQDLGDHMREATDDYAAVAQGMLKNVRRLRSEKTKVQIVDGEPVEPDDEKRAYIFDSIRHPAEVSLLRTVYHDAFTLIGVVCQEEVRKTRLIDKFFDHRDKGKQEVDARVTELMERDADDKRKSHGQHVADAFYESDYFVDNTADSKGDKTNWQINEMLGRLVDIVTHARIVRPTIPESAMHYAMTTQLRSSCLSRQVGAAIVDKDGDIISTGANEVPKSGGGVYGKTFSIEQEQGDARCFCSTEKTCSSNVEQNELAEKLATTLSHDGIDDIIPVLRKAGLKDLLEFSRAVHAEMDAITSAARMGRSVKASKMFVTTFPCHYCARHIVASGVDEVQYIEPYPKSRALTLHKDSITSDEVDWVPPGVVDEEKRNNKNYQKVLFKPFVGVSPRLYIRAFTKDRPLKNTNTGEMDIGVPQWGNKWKIKRVSYTQLEAELTKDPKNENP